MHITSITCPKCSKALMLAQTLPAGTKVRCTACGQPFALSASVAAMRPNMPDLPRPRGNGLLLGVFVVGLLVIAGAVVGVPLFLEYFKDKGPAADGHQASSADRAGEKDRSTDDDGAAKEKDTRDARKDEKRGTDKKPSEETSLRPNEFDPNPAKKPDPITRPDPIAKPDPITRPDPIAKPDVKPADVDLSGEQKAKVNEAIRLGVDALLHSQSPAGSWGDRAGVTALVGMTLLECGVSPKHEVIQKAAEFVRVEAIKAVQVYTIATAILFLDRFGDPVDVPLLETLTVRLLSAQLDDGGFAYTTAPIPGGEEMRLEEYYKQAKATPPAPVKQPRTVRDLAPENQQRLLQIRPLPAGSAGPLDNSNTQFATLALWIGRRYGVPVDGALVSIDRHYRLTQNADGGWGYRGNRSLEAATTASMTCAGILGLSMAHGLVLMAGKPLGVEARPVLDPARDAVLNRALKRVALNINEPPSVKKATPAKLAGTDIYFLWSLERIMVAMKIERLAGKDWYRWGAKLLVANQQPDGRWTAGYGEGGADTCFALLFLHKANLVKDLTIKINKLELAVEEKPEK
jgi:hypothetical protein